MIGHLLGAFRAHKEDMAQGTKPVVRKGVFPVPEGPGLGLDINEDWLNRMRKKGSVAVTG